MGFFMRLTQEKMPMTQMTCPYCHSDNISILQVQNQSFAQLDILLQTMSPATMASLGVKIAKHLGVPPAIGGLIGVVVGGTLVFVSQQMLNKFFPSNSQYICNNCERHFAIAAA